MMQYATAIFNMFNLVSVSISAEIAGVAESSISISVIADKPISVEHLIKNPTLL